MESSKAHTIIPRRIMNGMRKRFYTELDSTESQAMACMIKRPLNLVGYDRVVQARGMQHATICFNPSPSDHIYDYCGTHGRCQQAANPFRCRHCTWTKRRS